MGRLKIMEPRREKTCVKKSKGNSAHCCLCVMAPLYFAISLSDSVVYYPKLQELTQKASLLVPGRRLDGIGLIRKLPTLKPFHLGICHFRTFGDLHTTKDAENVNLMF